MRTLCIICALVAVLALWQALPAAAQGGSPPYESYYLYLGEHPSYEENGWSEDVQGLTHDRDYWYISQTWELWKIPVTRDLAWVDSAGGGVSYVNLTSVSQLAGYGHAGDLCYHQYGGVGYLLIPLEGSSGPGLAVFRAQNLQYLAHASLPGTDSAGWCAVNPQGRMYTSEWADVDRLYCYDVNWSQLQASGQLVVQRAPPNDFLLRDPAGHTMILDEIQGGDFSDGGQLLYLICGFYGEYDAARDGIHAFDVATGRQLAHSASGADPFNYDYDPVCEFGHYSCEEPEGLTVWDLDDGRAPNVWGQLHVLMLDNDRSDWTPWDPDDVSLKHYSHTIYVDGGYAGDEKGRYWDPFNTVAEAHSYAWDGARIGIRARRYPETLTLSKRVLLYPFDGTVTIGVGGKIRISPGATVRLYHNGAMRLQ